MVGGSLIYAVPQEITGKLINVIAALGGVIFLYLIFNSVNLFLNKRKNKELRKINENLEQIKKLLAKK